VADDRVQIEISVLDRATKSLESIQEATNSLAQTASKGFTGATSAFSVFQGALGAGLVLKSLEAVTDAAQALFQTFIVDGIKAASEYDDALNQLNVSLSQSGQFSESASEDFQRFAQSIQETTKFSDDAVLSAGALIQQIARLNTADLKTATQSALNLSAALGIDLNTAAGLVAKSIEGNTGALGRYGIKVKEGATESERFANTINALSFQNNAATATVNTLSGAVQVVRNGFSDLQKTFGQTITQNVAVVEVTKALGEVFKEQNGIVNQNSQAIREFVANGVLLLIVTLQEVVKFLDDLRRGFVLTVDVISIGINALGSGLTLIVRAVADGIQAVAEFTGVGQDAANALVSAFEPVQAFFDTNLKDSISSAAAALTEPSDTAKALGDVLGSLEDAAIKGFVAVQQGATASVEPINAATQATNELTEAQKKQFEELDKFIAKEREAAQSAEDIAVRRLELVQAQEEAEQITADEAFQRRELILAEQREQEEAEAIRKYDALVAQNEQLAIIDDEASRARIAANKAEIDAILKSREQGSAAQVKIQSDQVKKEREINKQRLTDTRDIFSNIATIAQAFGKEGFEIYKVAASAEAVVAGFLAVQQALASPAGFPFNFILAATVAGVTAANVAKINSAKPPGLRDGIDSVPGTGFADNFPAVLAPGERVVPRRTNEDLTSFLSQQGNTQALLASIDSKLDRLQNNFTVQIGDRTIVQEIRSALDSGRVLTA
jgi:hypothetical protein